MRHAVAGSILDNFSTLGLVQSVIFLFFIIIFLQNIFRDGASYQLPLKIDFQGRSDGASPLTHIFSDVCAKGFADPPLKIAPQPPL